ncbi:MAG: competence/damage-inducible protein A [Rhodobacterales bacterium]|nr:competence/damage-inducible protein A [Rhodobacterales bacterium]
MPSAFILSQGDEVVTGQVVDTNAAWLAVALTELGFDVVGHASVGDRLTDLVQVIERASQRADVVLCTGGLGPTQDDLTAQAVAQAFNSPLVFDDVAMAHIEARYRGLGRTMPEVNRKQAWLPSGAIRLDNDWGTAPGFTLQTRGALMVFVAGVPHEMRKLWQHRIQPLLVQRFHLQPGYLVTLRTVGVGESNLQELLHGVSLGDAVLSFRTKLPENHVKLRFGASVSPEARLACVQRVATAIGQPVFSVEGQTDVDMAHGVDDQGGNLATVIGRALSAAVQQLAVAESCTGGRVSAACTAIPGSSAWFSEGVVTYSNAAKVRLLGVLSADLDQHGAVSEVVARQMAEGVRKRANVDYGISTTGIAGPGGGTSQKPIGLVHMALATASQTTHREVRFSGNRERIQELAAATVLDMLRCHLQLLQS